jgi:hypothetical protein
MATTSDFYIEVIDTGMSPYPWTWELRRRSEPMGARLGVGGFQSRAAAERAGKLALDRFLRELAKAEPRKR